MTVSTPVVRTATAVHTRRRPRCSHSIGKPHAPNGRYRPFSFGLAMSCSISSEYANPQYRSMLT